MTAWPDIAPPSRSRVVFAAAHVVADPAAVHGPGVPARLDWDATMRFRHRLWSLGLGVADAMDTAQRGMGLDWPAARELIRRSGTEARAVGGRLACGAATDQLPPGPAGLEVITAAYEEQAEAVEQAGAQVVLMCSRQLAAAAAGPDDYAEVYGRLLGQAERPVILHWLGEAFDPALRGYWGGEDTGAATGHLLTIIREHASQVDGVKVSLLDADREVAIRRALPSGVRLYTGDDFNFPELIAGDAEGHSDALLGVFDALAGPAATALRALDAGHVTGFRAVLDPLVPLARHIFAAPTRFYKTGLTFLAWLAGYQDHFVMLGGQQDARDADHLGALYRMAADASLFPDPELAAERMRRLLDG
ncbi:MAG TPA: dihydrodipicolinate synthase family protein [Streptosporangiaceae bacterium]|nr:dihydrodipicolinate synthase family protein [Streptosporangiaceae bacterium]